MEDPMPRTNRTTRNPTTTPVERSPTFSVSSNASPWFTPGGYSRAMEIDEEENHHHKDFSEEEHMLRRSHSRGRERDVGETVLAGVGWDWRSRKWVHSGPHGHPQHYHHHHHQQHEDLADESLDGRISRLRRDAGRMAIEGRLSVHDSRQSGWVSELEGISERRRRYDHGGHGLSRVRKEKVGLRSRRRAGYHVMEMHSRRKLARREHQLRREINTRRNLSSAKGQGAVVSSLQILGESLHATKSFSLQTLEEYLKEREAARKLQNEENSDSLGLAEIGSSGFNSVKYLEQPHRMAKKTLLQPINDISNDLQHQLPVSIYASEDGLDEDSDGQRSGCGMSWRWSNARHAKDVSFMPYAGGCFPTVSRRRIGRRLLVSRNRKGYKWDKYNSEGSFCSDSDLETVPLMTEPEPFHDYTTDDVVESSVELDRGTQTLYREFKLKKASRFKEDGRSSNGHSYRRGERDSDCKEVGLPIARNEKWSIDRHRSLSQKNRPKAFKDLVGQTMVAQSLSNAVLRGKIAPVYLFQGPRGTGKTSAARMFTAALNCLSAEELRPCGLCKECSSLHAGKNFDVREVDAAANNGIESMRLLLKHLSLPPSSRYKVFIIDECHLLAAEAWNAFLKSLEEPPSYVVFILVTTDPDQLPRTALSRCQKFLFSKIKDADIVLRLRKIALQENIDVELDALQLIASRSDGSLRDAETTLDQISLLGKRATLSVVQELVGLIPEDKLAEFLELALSPDTTSTVKSIREFMDSGVEPLALISQLATLITDILAGNNRAVGYRLKHVMKVEEERFRQALRTLSDAEKQLRSCSDRSTWLTAAFLQFSQMDGSIVPPSSLGTSVTQSPVNFFDTSEKETLEGESKWDTQSPLQMEYVPERTGKAERADHNRPNSQNIYFSGPFMGNKVYPCNHSPKSARAVDDVRTSAGANRPPVKPRAYSTGVIDKVEQREARTMSSCSMDSIWRKVLDNSRSNVIKQLLRGEGRLLSLSVTEALAVAHLEFRHPEHKAMAEGARTSIANAFQEALCCPVEVNITLSSSPAVHGGGSPSVSGKLEQQYKQKRIVSLSKVESKSYYMENESGRSKSGSFRKSSGSLKFGVPVSSSPRIRLSEHRKPRQSLDVDQSSYNQRYDTDLSEGDRSNIVKGKSREGADHVVESDGTENRRVSVHYEFPKGRTYSVGRSSDELVLQQSEDTGGTHDVDSQSKGKAGNIQVEPRFSPSPMEGNDIDNDSSDSETRERYGPSILCWKGSRMNDGKVKHQRLRRKRRGRLLLRLVPCAKGEGRS